MINLDMHNKFFSVKQPRLQESINTAKQMVSNNQTVLEKKEDVVTNLLEKSRKNKALDEKLNPFEIKFNPLKDCEIKELTSGNKNLVNGKQDVNVIDHKVRKLFDTDKV